MHQVTNVSVRVSTCPKWDNNTLNLAYSIGMCQWFSFLIQIRVWARPEYVQDLEFALSQAAAIHDYYETYTGIADPMPKLGM
jgi:hypothetical protein